MTSKPYHSDSLDKIRQEIDALDTQLHETLVRRAELVLKIGEEKRKNNIEIVQPAREARMIRRLLSRHMGVMPEMAVVRIWRELVGAVSLLQTGLSVTVAESNHVPEYWDLAKDYFGSCLPMTRASSPLTAISAVREGSVTFAVLPYPTGDVIDTDQKLWWEMLDEQEGGDLSIIVRLPHGDDPDMMNPDCRALIVGKSGFDGSDHDNSFLYIACNTSMSRDKIVSVAKENGLKPISLSSKIASGDMATRKHLLEVEGYYTKDSNEIAALQAAFGENVSIRAAGGYPVPVQYAKTIEAKTDKAA